MTGSAPELRRAFLNFVLSIAVLEVVAIGILFAARIRERPEQTQHIYIGVWMAVSLIVVLRNLKIMRKYRVRDPRVNR